MVNCLSVFGVLQGLKSPRAPGPSSGLCHLGQVVNKREGCKIRIRHSFFSSGELSTQSARSVGVSRALQRFVFVCLANPKRHNSIRYTRRDRALNLLATLDTSAEYCRGRQAVLWSSKVAAICGKL